MLPFTARSRPGARAVVVAGAAALAAISATALPAAANIASQGIRQAPCTGATFTVYYGANSVTCYQGTGQLPVRLYPVQKITTGENTGFFGVIAHGTHAVRNFTPRQVISFPAPFPATLTLIDITST
jgi:hypothetical protein